MVFLPILILPYTKQEQAWYYGATSVVVQPNQLSVHILHTGSHGRPFRFNIFLICSNAGPRKVQLLYEEKEEQHGHKSRRRNKELSLGGEKLLTTARV